MRPYSEETGRGPCEALAAQDLLQRAEGDTVGGRRGAPEGQVAIEATSHAGKEDGVYGGDQIAPSS